MRVTELPKHWESSKQDEERPHHYDLQLPMEDAARIAALSELYPDRSEADILNDMIAAALDDLANETPLKSKLESVKKS
ncbi:hypothetical protein C8D92_101199 [Tamilnaduibacter salinus]|uniref:Uncharacterized protein n=1 Tax=Tamilnaduibacter salinus TaxID=1484056 RepID=A0A2A2I7Z8_9GAMM|nr:hypothetical protein [Tamilnaduibacter salinus]PAV27173.1 hypothetical protein CF392_01600 [Tamilnaduibacter salinus]PVY78993.1 hypothetical protein C8D92_101199 [Tamilnaduibacter salinus]